MSNPTTPAMTAATEVALLVNTAWTEDDVKPTCLARLTPVVNTNDGTEMLPAAYAMPIAHSLKRVTRYHYDNSLEVALVFISEADSEATAQALMDDFHAAVKAVLDKGVSSGAHFVSADIVDPFDYDLLANSGIFRCQANIKITMVTENQ